MFDKHPIAIWSSIIITLVTMAAGVAGSWYYITDERERSIEQSKRLADIRREQENIRKELALQTADLEEIRQVQRTIISTVERRFDKIEDGHDRIVSEISHTSTAIALELGRIAGQHEGGHDPPSDGE